ncbi:MAG: hypothetical protein IPO64_16075 [Bacteroidetes bacterium]|nr:hypothetical protein [Bacteroidota bacterium]
MWSAALPSWDDLYLNGKGGVLINSDCLEEGAKTITHEIGHHFDLLHTFETANGKGTCNPQYWAKQLQW